MSSSPTNIASGLPMFLLVMSSNSIAPLLSSFTDIAGLFSVSKITSASIILSLLRLCPGTVFRTEVFCGAYVGGVDGMKHS